VIRRIAKADFVKGRWRNGRGVSWDIASDQSFSQSGEFGWRLAMAEIAESGPFSVYGAVDRVFTLLSGKGLDLLFAGGSKIAVGQPFVPHSFACDVAADCELRDGPCAALNLFTAREKWRAEVDVTAVDGEVPLPRGVRLLFALQGDVSVRQGHVMALAEGDAADVLTDEPAVASGDKAMLYTARLIPQGI